MNKRNKTYLLYTSIIIEHLDVFFKLGDGYRSVHGCH
jgi:hypothetical protein